ncbi:MAG: hypothetical protein LBT16_14085 [Treponema sp.]|nr:hypothetical protein [Treponema sp.]
MLSPVLSSFNIPQYLSKKKPSFLVESLIVVPFTSPVPNLLAVYNSLSRIRDLKGRLYRSFTRNADVPLFENAMRLESERKLNAIPDPPPASSLPSAETNYILLKDINFGNSYYRAELSVERPGLVYTLTNFKTLSYLFIPVIRENKFFTQFYIEPIEEGVLLYCVAGADVSDFVARKVDIPSAIEKRIRVIMDWIIDGFQ